MPFPWILTPTGTKSTFPYSPYPSVSLMPDTAERHGGRSLQYFLIQLAALDHGSPLRMGICFILSHPILFSYPQMDKIPSSADIRRRERRPRRSGGCDAQASCPHSPGPARLGECNKVFCKPAPYFAQLCLTMVPSESKIAFGIVCCPGLAPAALL